MHICIHIYIYTHIYIYIHDACFINVGAVLVGEMQCFASALYYNVSYQHKFWYRIIGHQRSSIRLWQLTWFGKYPAMTENEKHSKNEETNYYYYFFL